VNARIVVVLVGNWAPGARSTTMRVARPHRSMSLVVTVRVSGDPGLSREKPVAGTSKVSATELVRPT